MNLNSIASAFQRSPAPEPKITPDVAKHVLGQVTADDELKQTIIKCIHNAELEALNDSLPPCRRTTHRGSRAEEQAISFLGTDLPSLGFEIEEVENQFRFIHFDRYDLPVRFLVVRANKGKDGQFETWKKGEKATLLLQENKGQLTLFDFHVTLVPGGALNQGEHDEDLVLNIWIVADGSSEADKSKDDLSIHLIIPIGIKRGASFFARRLLEVIGEVQIFADSLGAPILLPAERVEAAEIKVDAPLRRDEEAS